MEDVFVPEHRMFSMSAVADGRLPVPSDEPMYRHPFAPLATLPLVGPGLGLGRSALALTVEQAAAKPMHHTFFARQSDSARVHPDRRGRTETQDRAIARVSRRRRARPAVAADEELHYVARAEMRAEMGLVSRQVLEALQLLVDVHGAGSFAEVSRMQQYWRDANVAARHAGLNAAVGYEIFGKALLGVPDRISPMV